jgi:hypothetical protein
MKITHEKEKSRFAKVNFAKYTNNQKLICKMINDLAPNAKQNLLFCPLALVCFVPAKNEVNAHCQGALLTFPVYLSGFQCKYASILALICIFVTFAEFIFFYMILIDCLCHSNSFSSNPTSLSLQHHLHVVPGSSLPSVQPLDL